MKTFVYYYGSDDENDDVDFTNLTNNTDPSKDWYWIITYVVKDEEYIVWDEPTSVEGPFGYHQQLFAVKYTGTGSLVISLNKKDSSLDWNMGFNKDPNAYWARW